MPCGRDKIYAMKNLIISLLVIASVSAFTYLSVCDYISADSCRRYVMTHQQSLQWHPEEFPYRHFGYPESKLGGCFVLPLNDYGMGYYTDMTIQRIGSNSCEIIAWSDREKFIYRWRKVDRVFVIENDSLLMSVIRNKIPKDTVIAVSYGLNKTAAHELFDAYTAQDEFLRKNIQNELCDSIRALSASYVLDSIGRSKFEDEIRLVTAKIKLQGKVRVALLHMSALL